MNKFTATSKTPLLGLLIGIGKDKKRRYTESRAYVAVLLFTDRKPQASPPSNIITIDHRTCGYAVLRNIPQDKNAYGISIYRSIVGDVCKKCGEYNYGYRQIAVLPMGTTTWADRLPFADGIELIIEDTDRIAG
jgi:hypothetical protein